MKKRVLNVTISRQHPIYLLESTVFDVLWPYESYRVKESQYCEAFSNQNGI